ncbi:sugar ABC transporter ATP-binding protein [Lichenifustis flavocetrariae]|uniref:Sugar ABC transporter ATP-binding protein n=1 Tax=Lichenifustis flavocetrariae TaxID=2949735 RepID=A0AA41Z8P3_9HYPH|nr:sugar ABC transporter ATP-binding protein [Lichenifustis flavocetrariae]MCW6512548.1 sugar ABC transporter ATP-binding protein [Lichenifustis flavocetrariae]
MSQGGPAGGTARLAAREDAAPALLVSDISKTFGGARALKGVTFSVRPGEVHGLLGQNGSGKSTFVKILSGFHAPDPGGQISVFGRVLDLPMRAGRFRDYRIAFVHQNLGLVPSLSVLENLRVASITARRAGIDWRHERKAAQAALDRFGIRIDLRERVAAISQVDRALLAIVRASDDLGGDGTQAPGILVLDEPTPFLPKEGVDRLFGLVRQVVARGTSVIFISHDIDEVRDITDRATILRDGAVSTTLDTASASHDDFVEGIVGRRIARQTVPRPAVSARAVRASVRALAEPGLALPRMDLHEGEIVGMTGLIGSGYERVPYLLFGATQATSGTLELDGESIELSRTTPKASVRRGMALLPADRPKASGVGSLSVAENMMVLDLGRFMGPAGLRRAAMTRRTSELAGTFEIRPNSPGLRLGALSGGNAQKVLLAKWLIRNPKLLMLDEPTQGVDVGTRQQVFGIIRKTAADGASVLCASSDFEQLAELCHRVLIFVRGRVAHELTGDDISKEHIAERCYGPARHDLH